MKIRPSKRIEWPTLALVIAVSLIWLALVFGLSAISTAFTIPPLAVVIALHASLQHEAIHGHPFRNAALNTALVWPPLTLAIPYLRYRDTHLAHHNDEHLTDPYDDPESNYLAPDTWNQLSAGARMILRANNTLAGRMIIGPLIGTCLWAYNDLRSGDGAVWRGWLIHIPAVACVVVVVWVSPMPVWAYAVAAYGGLSLLKIRTFLEHQAHLRASGRSVIIEDRGPLAFLFLNNNLHVVHHMHPKVPWYDLPALYRSRREHYQRRNGGYVFASYADIFRRYLWRRKDPVVHPLWRPR